MRLAAIGQPVIPEAEFLPLSDVRFHFRVLALLPALRLKRIGREVGPHPRHEGDPLAVGEPFRRGASGGEPGEPLRFAAVGRDQVELRFVVVLALRGERDPLAVGRPFRIAVLVAGGELARPAGNIAAGLAERRREKPQRRAAVVLLHVVAGHGRAGESTRRRQRRRADAFDLPQRFERQRRLALRGTADRASSGAGHRWVLVGTMCRGDSNPCGNPATHLLRRALPIHP